MKPASITSEEMPKSNECSPFVRQCFVTCAVCCNIIGQGCAVGFPGVLLPQLARGREIPLSEEEGSWIASVMAVSIVLGNAAAGPLMGRLGRKPAAHAVAGTAALGWAILALAPNFATLIVGRVAQGVSYGIIMPLRPALIGECTSPRHRGSFLTTISLSQTIGIAFVHLTGSLLRWQYTAIICCGFPVLSLILTLFSPESPSWLALKGRYDECREAFHWLRGENENEELEKMIQTRIEVQQDLKNAEKVSTLANIKQVARKKEVYKPVILAMHVYALAQCSGSITLPSYSTDIIGAMLGKESNVHFWMIELDVLRFVVNAAVVFVIARIRRRTLMFTACALSIVSHAGIAGYSYAKLIGLIDAKWLPILLLNFQMAAVGFGMVPMANVITGEIFPLQYRSILSAVSVIMVAATMFLILKTFPAMLLAIGLHGSYAVYLVIVAYGTIVTWFLLPETKGRTLQQIEEHFRGKPLVPEEAGCELRPLNTNLNLTRMKFERNHDEKAAMLETDKVVLNV